MTEKLPIESWQNGTTYIIYLFHTEILNESHLIGLQEEDEPFLFTDYQWYLVPLDYHTIIREMETMTSIYSNQYLVVQHGRIYWIANRVITS
jgi:hypothetical protein